MIRGDIDMKDYIIRAITKSKHIRIFVASTTNLVEKARSMHDTYPVATAALGRTLTASAIMGIMLKGDNDTLTIQIKGKGELGGIVVVSDSKANVRGYVNNPSVDIPLNAKGKLDVSGAIGKGYLNVIKDIGLKDTYGGQVPLISGEIAEDIAYYFLKSDQINSAVGMGVLVDRDYSVIVSGGFIIQAMPDIEEDEIVKLENVISDISSVTDLFNEHITPEKVLEVILKDFEYEILDKVDTNYKCTCSKDRMERALISLGKDELRSLIDEQGEAELNCQFCDEKYIFNKEALNSLYKESIG